ncbi:hypothetical protein F3Y22_tig00110783pilonHSYRG00286 [Hibiscus syriacus]|uniref:Uncharacterized protein n=1 Tax=Hibiscus syriacus TaxID=106335 RepID=A0A6A2ZRQ3_HIBSY|nr:hypothetical protein F3Y22_tig00110783pilonHSYRG00286 [Hibiscus syriacus]
MQREFVFASADCLVPLKLLLLEFFQVLSVVATSTTEVEYVAATQASKEAIWLKMLLEELGHNQEYVSLFCDKKSALHLARNPTFHSRKKHIRVQYHFIREKVKKGTVDMQKIHTKNNIADFMTKAINADKFTWCRSSCDLLETRLPQQWDQHLQCFTSIRAWKSTRRWQLEMALFTAVYASPNTTLRKELGRTTRSSLRWYVNHGMKSRTSYTTLRRLRLKSAAGILPSLDILAYGKNYLFEISRPVTNEEIKQVIFDMVPSKAPGVDELHVLFYQSEETINHLFRECPLAIDSWKKTIRPEKLLEFLRMNFKEWMQTNLLKTEHFAVEARDWDILFSSLLWAIWKHRNQQIFDPGKMERMTVYEYGKRLQADAYKQENQP